MRTSYANITSWSRSLLDDLYGLGYVFMGTVVNCFVERGFRGWYDLLWRGCLSSKEDFVWIYVTSDLSGSVCQYDFF